MEADCRKNDQKKGQKAQLVWRPVVKKATVPPPTNPPGSMQGPIQSTEARNVTPIKRLVQLQRQDYSGGGYSSDSFGAHSYKEVVSSPPRRSGGANETKIKSRVLKKVINNFNNWCISTNNGHHNGGRIWILWQHQAVKVSGPWAITSDFNCVLSAGERVGGNTPSGEMEPFRHCVADCGVIDIDSTGSLFTWNNKQKPEERIYSRIDRFLRKRCFKYFNMWGEAKEFLHTVRNNWKKGLMGTSMFRLVKNLKHLKPSLKSLNKEGYNDIEHSTSRLQKQVHDLQEQLGRNPTDTQLLIAEFEASQELKKLSSARDSFLAQKAKQFWMKEGGTNSAYFHGILKKRRNGNRATTKIHRKIIDQGQRCRDEHRPILLRPVTGEEIRAAVFSIPDNKSPGPDGYTSKFFKDAWNEIGGEVITAVQDFFRTRQLLKQVNATNVTLIPKCDRPQTVYQFRPIACCNVVYKVISKLLCARLAEVLPLIIDPNQGAFIQNRNIQENILICQDLIRCYEKPNASPRCLFKIDLQKAYDTVEWSFVEKLLKELRFPVEFQEMLMQCITTASFSLSLNGEMFGYFHGGERSQGGDPLSPLIFTLCMEYLTRTIKYAAAKFEFKYHPMCKQVQLANLMFADDRVHDQLKLDILSVSGFVEGKLPFKYLGMPIQTTRLQKQDCECLVEKICSRIHGYGAKKFSYAWRLVLVKAVLTTLHSYWASLFVLPKGILAKVEAACRNLL
ncbi:uncharacterized protein LOC141651643 [Silene latifolia]|uniref:uncharacterized protein LOC141651643 n=1 Tax=Silene latifolia TaxID=37657 RepID=UPI003D76A960